MDKKLVVRYFLRESMGILVMLVAMLWPAGRIDWWPAWAATAVMAGWIAATAYFILRYNPSLLAERLGPRKGAKTWDTAIMSFLGLLQLARYIIAGFDQRNGWTGEFSIIAQIIALVVCALGYVLVVWATASNAFFSQIVRIQPERGQTVATGGPYHFIRHPAYTGAILYELAVSILLASWWSFIPGVINAFLIVLRTALEDRTLQAELDGYTAYAHKICYRLIPGIW